MPVGKPFKTTLPVATVQVGCVIFPTKGADGVKGCVLIITFSDATDVHPTELVTVKVCVPAGKSDIVVPAPVPEIELGLMVHVPDGKSFNITLPVETEQVGWVIIPIVGTEGVSGCAFIITSAVAIEVHPTELVTVKEYVPGTNPKTVLIEVEPDIAPGLIVQFPAGKPVNLIFPVATVQVGWVIVPNVGTAGVIG